MLSYKITGLNIFKINISIYETQQSFQTKYAVMKLKIKINLDVK